MQNICKTRNSFVYIFACIYGLLAMYITNSTYVKCKHNMQCIYVHIYVAIASLIL